MASVRRQRHIPHGRDQRGPQPGIVQRRPGQRQHVLPGRAGWGERVRADQDGRARPGPCRAPQAGRAVLVLNSLMRLLSSRGAASRQGCPRSNRRRHIGALPLELRRPKPLAGLEPATTPLEAEVHVVFAPGLLSLKLCSPRSSRRPVCPPTGRRAHGWARGDSNLEVTERLRTGEMHIWSTADLGDGRRRSVTGTERQHQPALRLRPDSFAFELQAPVPSAIQASGLARRLRAAGGQDGLGSRA
jgi:hypothetical protein